MTAIIETERLMLRPLRESDFGDLVRQLNNLNISRNTARIPYPYTLKDAEEFYVASQTTGPRSLRRMMARKSSDRVIGAIGYEGGVAEAATELGYWLAEAEWGKGFGGEAARAITDHAFEIAGHDRLVAGYRIGNEASRRILDRLGFRDTARIAMFSKGAGTEVPVMRMELTRQHWAEAKGRGR